MVGYTSKWLFVERECMTVDSKRNACVGNRHRAERGRGWGAIWKGQKMMKDEDQGSG